MKKKSSFFITLIACLFQVPFYSCHLVHERYGTTNCPVVEPSSTRTLGSEYGWTSPTGLHDCVSASIHSATLTAGQINDFGKWKLWQDITKDELSEYSKDWDIQPLNRYMVQVITQEKRPVTDCSVILLSDDGNEQWISKTDNTGKAELWANMFNKSLSENYSVKILYNGTSYSFKDISPFERGVNVLTIPVACRVHDVLDIAFVLDATGSMDDEMEYLKKELNGLAMDAQKNNPQLILRIGVVLYRDFGDDYVTKKIDLSSDIVNVVKFISENNAKDGGDYQEAMDVGLNTAINDLSWSEQAINRLLFLISDAPPHETIAVHKKLEKVIVDASQKGVRIIPVGASGINKSTEFLMRSMALATNGTYVFLTDNSGVGNPHIMPSTDSYNVEYFNKLLYRLIIQYSRLSSCDAGPQWSFEDLSDTTWVKIIEHIVLSGDTTDSVQQQPPLINVAMSSSKDASSLENDTPLQIIAIEKSFRFYPNPTTGKVSIEIFGDIKELFLADINGKLLQEFPVKNSGLFEIDISRFPPGMYLLLYENEGKVSSGKILLQ